MDLKERNVVFGYEGCGKSSSIFNYLNNNTTKEEIVIFSFKNYFLMREQRINWIERYGLDESEIVICGFNQDYEEANDSYTNPAMPWEIPDSARFVFITQALLQRNRHLELQFEKEKKPIKHIVIDEFDFQMGIIPTFDYLMSAAFDGELTEKIKKEIVKWVSENYTRYDAYAIQHAAIHQDKGFKLAHWIESSICPVTFLTSELLATSFLELLGFEVHKIASNFIDCKIHVSTSDVIGRNFFSRMNNQQTWNKIGFDVIISDYIGTLMEESELHISVVNHMKARGSNAFIGDKLLTVISHIPQKSIIQIRDAFNYFIKVKKDSSDTLSYKEVSALFYRDRLMQAVGRTIGNRGGNEAWVWVHEDIWKHIDHFSAIDFIVQQVTSDFADVSDLHQESLEMLSKNPNITKLIYEYGFIPYQIENDFIDFNGYSEVRDAVLKMNDTFKEERGIRQKEAQQFKKAQTCSTLEKYFELDASTTLTYDDIKKVIEINDIKSITGTGMLQPAKVARFFGCHTKKARVDGKPQNTVIGLKIKE